MLARRCKIKSSPVESKVQGDTTTLYLPDPISHGFTNIPRLQSTKISKRKIDADSCDDNLGD
jgi:hypothetical protein